MKKIDNFTNRYSLAKTLRFSLLPIGKTEENFGSKQLLEKDLKLAENYKKVKGYIDDYHRKYIEETLSKYQLEGVAEYAKLYYNADKSDNGLAQIEKAEDAMRKSISKALTSDSKYKKFFKKEMITELLPDSLKSDKKKEEVKSFENFTTYFTGFNENRALLYSDAEKHNTIAYRCINENLPRFLDNANNFKKISEALPKEIEKLNSDFVGIFGTNASNIFDVDYFSFVLSQSGIDNYNNILGGYVCDNGTKVPGLNEYINLYNQQSANKKLPFMKPLYKQILTISNTISFAIDKFEDDNAVIAAVNQFYTNTVADVSNELEILFKNFSEKEYDTNGIFVRNDTSLTNLSNAVFGSWNIIKDAWKKEYISDHPLTERKNEEKYYEEIQKAYSKIKSFSLNDIQEFVLKAYPDEITAVCLTDYYKTTVSQKTDAIKSAYKEASSLLTETYQSAKNKKLCKNDSAVKLIKTLLDSIKELESVLKGLLGSGKEKNKDDVFYGRFLPLYDSLSEIDVLYDKVRNYITQKPYSTDKIKLNFENSQLMQGWDVNKESDHKAALFRKNGKYYLAITDKNSKVDFAKYICTDKEDYYEKVEYKLLPGPNKMLPKVFFAGKNIKEFNPSDEIVKIREKESFKKGNNFNLDDCHKLIDFYKDSIKKHKDWSKFEFKFTPTKDYENIGEFYNEVKNQGYKITYRNIRSKDIDDLVDSGKIYLFQIYNKDFSEHSHGNKNLHTQYFEMLFDENNLKDVVFQINGDAEIFYRKASIKSDEKIVHYANVPIPKKKLSNKGQTSLYHYDIIKDKRFTKHQFSLHLPITLNYKSGGNKFINADVRTAIRNFDNNYIIGIDRGERNLIYICVINEKGEIIEQKSFNVISDNNDEVNYHTLLENKEKNRDSQRKSWSEIENIKELKEGYLSQVIHEICNLVIKYDAIIALEDLNYALKNSRVKVEKQVYQKFENMLISKLRFLTDKNANPQKEGGLLKAYQLTNSSDFKANGLQNGVIFYVRPWLTSKIDPKTGFVNLLNTKYESIEASINFFKKFDDIRFNAKEDMFEFVIDYSKFERGSLSYKKNWTICSSGERIITSRNSKNNAWETKTICLTNEFKNLFEKSNVDYKANLKENIIKIKENIPETKDNILKAKVKSFFKDLLKLLSYTLQMRNSVIGGELDYIISPVKDSNGNFFDSRLLNESLPKDADANGAYNIARKALLIVKRIKETPVDKLDKLDISVKDTEWLEFAQNE